MSFSSLKSIAWLTVMLILPVIGSPQISDEAQLLKIHKDLLQSHLRADLDSWLASESDEYVVANRGEVTHPTKRERAGRIGPYLKRTKFREYRDLIQPVVRVSKDDSMAWLIAQVKASGVQVTDNGKEEPIEFISAWIELFEKKDGRWMRVGNVSNFKPTE
jgi:hypothetical protein